MDSLEDMRRLSVTKLRAVISISWLRRLVEQGAPTH